jgi:hypothetical protein
VLFFPMIMGQFFLLLCVSHSSNPIAGWYVEV